MQTTTTNNRFTFSEWLLVAAFSACAAGMGALAATGLWLAVSPILAAV